LQVTANPSLEATATGKALGPRARESSGRRAMRSRANTFCPTLPEDTPINELVSAAHQRWRIERDYQDLKQDFGLGPAAPYTYR
jgi:SRSO17 transposase